jgi:tRNA(fMet)-specific endonuclease VapC
MPRPNGYLIDTNVVIALVRNNDLGKYLEKTYQFSRRLGLFTSVVVLGEAAALALKLRWNEFKQRRLSKVLDLPRHLNIFEPNVLQNYAEIDAYSESIGKKMGKNDLWIAATAKRYDLSLLTTDKDFDHLHPKHIDLIWVDPTSK